jgi:nucleoside 2-deoxyribosyltransferase
MSGKCSLCGNEAKYYNTFGRDCSIYDCPRCGRVEISGTMEAVLLNNPKYNDEKYLLSGITRYRTENGLKPITILSDSFEYLKDEYYVPRNVSHKLNLLLRYISKKSEYAGHKIEIKYGFDYPITFSKNVEEFIFIVEQLKAKKLIEQSPDAKYFLTVEGWNRIEELNTKIIDKKQGFVAMWFNKDLKDIYENGFRKAITDSGFETMRIDMKEHNNKIDDEIIAEIKNSAFLIADFTGQRGGVYYEAGFAMGLGIPVIWSCKKDEIDKVHFDTRQFNHITWSDTEDLYKQLFNRIKATIK